MKQIFKYQGNTYEGVFLPLPGKKNYGHFMVGGILLKERDSPDGEKGKEVVFGLGRGDEVFVLNEENFIGFANLKTEHKMSQKSKPTPKPTRPIELNKREDIHAMSKDAEEIMTAMRKAAVDGIVFLKEVKNVNPNKLYGHLINLEKAGKIQRVLKDGKVIKDSKRGTKVKIL